MKNILLILIFLPSLCFAKWETIVDQNPSQKLGSIICYREYADEGWLIKCDEKGFGRTIMFYPDKYHEWKLKK